MVELCMHKWNAYLECVNKYDSESTICKPLLKDYNECVFYNERLHVISKPRIIEKQYAVRIGSNYWSLENAFVWWSL